MRVAMAARQGAAAKNVGTLKLAGALLTSSRITGGSILSGMRGYFISDMAISLIDYSKSVQEFGIDAESQILMVGDRGGVDGLHVDLVAAVLHVDQRAVASVEELRVAMHGMTVPDGLLKDVVVLAVAGEHSAVTAALAEQGVFLHDCLQVDAEVGVLLHVQKAFEVLILMMSRTVQSI